MTLESDQRTRYDNEHLNFLLQKVQEMQKHIVDQPYDNLTQVALRFAAEPPGVSSIVVRAQSPAEVESNIRAFEFPPVDAELIEWLRREYGDLTPKANYT